MPELLDAILSGTSNVGTFGLVFGASALGGCCIACVRYVGRVSIARRRVYQLLAASSGDDARVVITGATSGIGEEMARQFLRHQSVSLLLGCRDTRRGERLFGHYGTTADGSQPRARVVHLELLDFDSVQTFTEEAHSFLSSGGAGLRLLVNNAGVMRPPPDSKKSASGLDSTWQTNFLGPFLLTELLAHHRSTKRGLQPVRVVQVSSRLERRSKLDAQLLEKVASGQAGEQQYADAKRALMLWTSVRAQSLAFKSGLWMHASTPGMVDTQLGRYSVNPWLWPFTKPLRMFLLKSPAEGVFSAVACGLQPKAVDQFGRYYDGETQLEDLVLERMGEKQFCNAVVKWAMTTTALGQRADGYDR